MDLASEAARGAYRWPVSAEALIEGPAARLWETISAPGSLLPSHPFLAANTIDRWDGADSRDEVHYLNGIVYRRDFRAWHEHEGFDLEISHRQKPLARVAWRIAPVDAAHASLRITVYPYGLQRLPIAVRWAPHLFVVRPRLRAYLSSVVRGYKWYIERGEAVPRNHFGTHPWFSAR